MCTLVVYACCVRLLCKLVRLSEVPGEMENSSTSLTWRNVRENRTVPLKVLLAP